MSESDSTKITNHPDLGLWKNMRRRCYRKSDKYYKNYGGRGIKICERWSDFRLFIQDMGRRPSKSHSLDRIDNNGDYCPENCRWATRTEQNRNMRTNHRVEFNGMNLTIAEWSERTGIKVPTILFRLKNGWTSERALTEPPTPQSQIASLSSKSRMKNGLPSMWYSKRERVWFVSISKKQYRLSKDQTEAEKKRLELFARLQLKPFVLPR